MIHLAGFGQPTVTGLRGDGLGAGPLDELDSYRITRAGDGSVPLALGPLRNPDGSPSSVPTYYFASEHSALTSNDDVLMAVDEALRTGACGAATRPAPEWAAVATAPGLPEFALAFDLEARRLRLARREADLRRVRDLIAELRATGPTGDDRPIERELTQLLGGEWQRRRPIGPTSIRETVAITPDRAL